MQSEFVRPTTYLENQTKTWNYYLDKSRIRTEERFYTAHAPLLERSYLFTRVSNPDPEMIPTLKFSAPRLILFTPKFHATSFDVRSWSLEYFEGPFIKHLFTRVAIM